MINVSSTAAPATPAAPSRARAIAFWVLSLPVFLETAAGAQWDLVRNAHVREVFERLGYPLYLLTLLGVAKVLAVVAFLVPRFPRLKEWAYAGTFFVYAGAAASHFAVNDPATLIVMPIVFAVLTLVSWALRPAERRDPAPLSSTWSFLRG